MDYKRAVCVEQKIMENLGAKTGPVRARPETPAGHVSLVGALVVPFPDGARVEITPRDAADGRGPVTAALYKDGTRSQDGAVTGPLRRTYRFYLGKDTYEVDLVPTRGRKAGGVPRQPGVKAYTVNFLFTPDGSHVLLQTKDRTDFAGMLNGVGGKLEPGETDAECALREIREETGCTRLGQLVWLGDLLLPEDCNADSHDKLCLLDFYAATACPEDVSKQPGETEDIRWYATDELAGYAPRLAGNGDVAYFIGQAMRRLAFTKED